jgi:hypothetical protein
MSASSFQALPIQAHAIYRLSAIGYCISTWQHAKAKAKKQKQKQI